MGTRKVSRFLCCVGLVLCVGALHSCGYTAQSSLDEQYQTIHVEAFKNASRDYGLQAPLTNAVIRKFLHDGRLRVVDHNQADLMLSGAILDWELDGKAFDDDDVTQFIGTVTAGVRLTDLHSGEVLWEESPMAGESIFFSRGAATRLGGNAQTRVTPVRSFQTEAENQAAANALDQLAADIFYRTIEPW